MVEDFEWKIHEIESGTHIKNTKITLHTQLSRKILYFFKDFHRKLKEAVAEAVEEEAAALTASMASASSSSSASSRAIGEVEVERRLRRARDEVGRQKDEEVAK